MTILLTATFNDFINDDVTNTELPVKIIKIIISLSKGLDFRFVQISFRKDLDFGFIQSSYLKGLNFGPKLKDFSIRPAI